MPVLNISRIIIAALVIMAGLVYLLHDGDIDAGESGQVKEVAEREITLNYEEEPLRVSTTKLERGTLTDELIRSGELASWREAEIYPKITAEVLEVYVSTDDQVSEGELLARLDGDDYRDEVRTADSSLQSARAQYREAEITYERLLDELKTMRELFKADAVSRQELLEMEDQMEIAKEGLQGAESIIRQSQIQLSAARRMLNRTEVSSPITGTVSTVVQEKGDMATTQAPLVIVDQLDPLKVELSVDGRYVNELEEGQEVAVEVDAVRGESLSGEVYEIYPTAVEGTRSFPVTVKVENPDANLRPGMYAEVNFTLIEGEESWLAAEDAVISRDDENYLFFVEDSHAAAYRVEIGLSSEGLVEVSGEFDPELDLIENPPGDLEDGEPVHVRGVGVD
ncbi:MAG: efflux RND transporter periplasmic adaptor subunit [Bacillota bacterium]